MMEEKTLCTVCRREANVFVMQRLRLFNGCVFGSRVNGEPRFYSPDDYREPGWEFSSLVATPEEALEIAEAEYRCFSEQRAWLEEKKRNWQPRPPRDEICPVMSVAEGGFYMCVRERCAWWVTWRGVNACAVTVQAMAMMKSSGLSGEDCSSRRILHFPVRADCGRRVEMRLSPQKNMQHNMGLCCMFGQWGGGGVGYSATAQGRRGKRPKKSRITWRNAL